MAIVRRLRLLLGLAAALGVVVFAVHAGAQVPTPGRYISWAPATTPAATPGLGRPIPVATAPPVTDSGPLGGFTAPLKGLLKQLNANTAQTERGQYSILQALEHAVATRIQQFLNWVTGGR